VAPAIEITLDLNDDSQSLPDQEMAIDEEEDDTEPQMDASPGGVVKSCLARLCRSANRIMEHMRRKCDDVAAPLSEDEESRLQQCCEVLVQAQVFVRIVSAASIMVAEARLSRLVAPMWKGCFFAQHMLFQADWEGACHLTAAQRGKVLNILDTVYASVSQDILPLKACVFDSFASLLREQLENSLCWIAFNRCALLLECTATGAQIDHVVVSYKK
jgi:hypothetical protein